MSSSANTTIDTALLSPPQSRIIVFIILIILLIPSVICSLYLFYKFIQRPEMRRRDTNLVFICLIIINFLQATGELPLTLTFLYTNQAAILKPIFCQWWAFFSAILYGTGLWIMAMGSIERYLFIFHSHALKKYRIRFRSISLMICFILPIGLYIFLVFLFPCTNHFIYIIFWCGAPCYMTQSFWQVFSWLIDNGIPMCIIVIVNIFLLTKVLCQKYRMQQINMWSKNARMLFQLMSVAILYAVCWLPFLISGQIMSYTQDLSSTATMLYLEYFVYLPYISVTLCPFVCLFSLSKEIFRRQ
ncbi:unnamed protein product [Adineta steineri]|uniref:G-protein coupled receptors family 1 profile domain-containing protein n=1 Tax=Adineta steineri TaxID=433720 RepID=A0A819C2N2_9BILA|nr:unnamed protein product [Adineta steineri]